MRELKVDATRYGIDAQGMKKHELIVAVDAARAASEARELARPPVKKRKTDHEPERGEFVIDPNTFSFCLGIELVPQPEDDPAPIASLCVDDVRYGPYPDDVDDLEDEAALPRPRDPPKLDDDVVVFKGPEIGFYDEETDYELKEPLPDGKFTCAAFKDLVERFERESRTRQSQSGHTRAARGRSVPHGPRRRPQRALLPPRRRQASAARLRRLVRPAVRGDGQSRPLRIARRGAGRAPPDPSSLPGCLGWRRPHSAF